METRETRIRWVASSSTSALHAANELRKGRKLADAAWQAALGEPAALLAREIASYGGRPDIVWQHLLALSAGTESNRQLAEISLRKTYGSGAAGRLESLVGAIGAVESAARGVQPQLADELLVRSRLLREQWEARGPGLLRKMCELVDPQLLPATADVLLVHPVRGGGGAAHLHYNSVRFEAVLTNSVAELPEVLRLAWLIAQLNQDLPMYSEQVAPLRLHEIAALALLPVTLLAGEHVELARCDEASLAVAADLWMDAAEPAAYGSVVYAWWQTYLETRPPWRIALQALERMLDSADSADQESV